MSNSIENTENRIQDAVKAYHQSTKPNIAGLARQFGASTDRLRGRIRGRISYADRAKISKALNLI